MKQPRHPLTNLLLFATFLFLVACGGAGGGGVEPTAGTAVFEPTGSTLRMRGRLEFLNAAGNPVASPTEGAVVLVGSGTRAGGANAQGLFTIDGLPSGVNLRVRCLARGFLPVDYVVNAGSPQTNSLQCRVDTNAADNPQLTNGQLLVPNDGIARYQVTAPTGTTVTMFSSPTLNAKSFGGASGDSLSISSQPQGNDTLFTGTIGSQIPTGSFYVLAAGAGGVSLLTHGTCQLTLSGYSRGGTLVGGKIMFGNVNCVGAEVLTWEEGNNNNRDDTTVGANGRFAAGLTDPPTGTVSVSVQWTDPNTGVIYVCLFTGNP